MVLEETPCEAGEVCNEPSDRCESAECSGNSDADGDGRDSLSCGGDDCDDDDASRYPGNSEVCDSAGHDEDCVEDTYGDRDEDGDGFVDSACCNGDRCGSDCDDSSSSISPTASESCNGVDDDCDDAVDETPGFPLCPGGACVAGRCRLDAWDRTFGGSGRDLALDVAMDSRGNVYVVGGFADAVRFGMTEETASGMGDAFVLSLAGDGAYRWHQTFGGDEGDVARVVAVEDDEVFVAGYATGTVDFGDGVPADLGGQRGFVVAFDNADGSHLWHADHGIDVRALTVISDAVVAGGEFVSTEDFGGGARSPTADVAGFIVRLSLAGVHRWDSVIDGNAGASISVRELASGGSRVFVAGVYDGSSLLLDGSSWPALGGVDLFVAGLEATDGTFDWGHAYADSGDTSASGLAWDVGGTLAVTGFYVGDFNLGTERNTTTAAGVPEGYLLGLNDSDGSYEWHHFLEGTGSFGTVDLVSAGGEFALLGGLGAGMIDLGGGLRSTPGFAAIVARYRADGTYGSDREYESGGTSILLTGLATGLGGSTALTGGFTGSVDLGSGERVSAGDFDALVFRPER
ncbi:MAG TPA: MopE-related protein [Sandaracinaceae bacterium LLY-WYZ-13_1]|nr:MopE-related protein [Sandaracinaceae bacterium LLY-WYZ-13_1]